jgi:hypothetical protein
MEDRAALWAYLIDGMEKFLHDKDATYPSYQVSPRQFMQTLGSEAGRKVRATFWIELAQRKWKNQKGVVLVTDCRFENEAEIADQIVLVRRPDAAPVAAHASEKLAEDLTSGLRTIPGMELVENTGTLEELEVEVCVMACSFATLLKEAA